ncbi:MCE family protein [Rhodococcus sp. NPDC058514]|uniref:MCE family protein n=1 Tax=unclassified Rhodococcus (in: high G+C Gram-positive bacteria) TaxID=192944 RepID=UPI00365B146B
MKAAVWKMGVFTVAMLTVLAGLVIVFGQLRFADTTTYRARFEDVSGLTAGDFVRVAGVESGRVSSVEVVDNDRSLVTMEIDSAYPVTEGTGATVRYANLVGDRYLELREGPGPIRRLGEGETIPEERTEPALDLDVLVGSFRPLLRTMEPGAIDNLTAELIAVLQGQGGTVESILQRAASFTGAIADRDQLVGEVITNLNAAVETVAGQREQFSSSVDQLQQLVSGLSTDRTPLAESVVRIDTATAGLAALLSESRAPLSGTISELGRTSAQLEEGRGTIESVVQRLPDTYAALSRLGAYGNFFNYYLCAMSLKVNGPDGQPVTIPLTNQTAGRCGALP